MLLDNTTKKPKTLTLKPASRWAWNAQTLPPSGLVTPQGALALGWDKVGALTAAPNALAATPNATAGSGFGLLPRGGSGFFHA